MSKGASLGGSSQKNLGWPLQLGMAEGKGGLGAINPENFSDHAISFLRKPPGKYKRTIFNKVLYKNGKNMQKL